MRRKKDGLRESLLESIADCGLDAKQSEMVENYLDGETDVCELQIDGIKDITKYEHFESFKKVKKCFERLGRHKEDELIRRYFTVMFQIFGISLNKVVIRNEYVNRLLPNGKRAAMYVADTCQSIWYHLKLYKNILEITNNREELKEALSYMDPGYKNGDLFLLAAMFYEGSGESKGNKMGLAELQEDRVKTTSGNMLGKLSRLLTGGGRMVSNGFEISETVKKYPEEFKRFTDMFPSMITAIYSNPSFSQAQEKVLRDYICDRAAKEAVPQEIIKMTQNLTLDDKAARPYIAMAAVNYRLSPVIYGFLKVCLAGHTQETLEIMLGAQGKDDMNAEVMRWYADFAPKTEYFILWLGNHDPKAHSYMGSIDFDPYPALADLAKQNPQDYVRAMKNAPVKAYEVLADALQKGVDRGFYAKHFAEVLSDAKSDMQQNVVQKLITDLDAAIKADVSGFLTGATQIDLLYPKEKVLAFDNYYATSSQPVLSYREVYGEDDFYDRCTAFLGLCGRTYTLTACCRTKSHVFLTELAEKFLESMKRGGLDNAHRLKAACEVYDNLWSEKDAFYNLLEKVFTKELAGQKEEMAKIFLNAPVSGRILGLQIMEKQAEQYKEELFVYFGATSKQVKEEVVRLFAAREEWGEDVLSVLKTSKKAGERELAATVIGKYKHPQKYREDLQEAYEKEKSSKAADAIKEALKACGAEMTGADSGSEDAQTQTGVTAQTYVKECHKGGKKRILSWLYPEPMPQVHFLLERERASQSETEGSAQTADEEYMQAILLSYAGMPVPGINDEVHILTDPLNRQELADFMDAAFDRWMAEGAQVKKKWILYATAIHGGAKIVPRLQHQINEWAASSRGAIAAEAVKALALNDSPTALLIVDGISRKYKFKQVKKAAQEALQFAAAQLNLTVEELADRIVPDLGFDERMERHFDYGTRSFTVRISPSLEIEVTNDAGKKIKTLPAVGKQDDEAKATAALAEFKELKKQMKTTVKNQALRLELALSIDRRWSVENWQKLFVRNPIMHQFAISLIWGYYEENGLKQTFRYMEDGTFNTADEEEYELAGNGTVGLLHPIDMDKEEIEAWKEQLSDYEITQSVEQLDRPVYTVTEEEREQKHLERFGGKIVNGLSLAGKLTGFGWSKGIPQDGGVYAEFYRRDTDADYGVELRFSGSYIGDENEEVTVYDASFYHLADMDNRAWKYNLKEDAKALKLDEVSPRYFSEAINQLVNATASSTETDEDWKKEL
ncbi:MAG: DUF4132 domain-containing protein [Lachnospiraceae bacterium]|nr:DUF4132 domain-containing protein [Lachnospiraceae bacterium]